MKAIIKSKEEIEIMKEGGKILADVLDIVLNAVKVGISTKELNDLVEAEILKRGAMPSFKDYIPEDDSDKKYPASLCVSVNDAIVHGIPDETVLKEGDVVGLDLGVGYKGYYTDAAVTAIAGKGNKEAKKLVNTAKKCLKEAIKQIKQGNTIGDISWAIQKTAEKSGFSVIRDLVGHGVGKYVHEPPEIPNFGSSGAGLVLKQGMTLAIEPMICAGQCDTKVLEDDWTVVTRDGSIAAHWEHTVAVMEKGCEILTK